MIPKLVRLQGNVHLRKGKWGADCRGSTIHGGTYMPVAGSYRTLMQCSRNVRLDGIGMGYIMSTDVGLLAPTGALVLMMVYCISAQRQLFQILSIYAFLYCYKCHSKSLKQYQCN